MKALTANRLIDGDVVFWKAGKWVERFADADLFDDAAAAERARNDRREVAARLRGLGVDVVDAPPDELAPALADHYLAMKAAGRL